MWMHFHGQMSTQPSQRMHSAWSMWRNCFGLTACGEERRVDFLQHVVGREVGHRRVGVGAGHRRHAFAFERVDRSAERSRRSGRPKRDVRGFVGGRLRPSALLPHHEQRDVQAEEHDVDHDDDDVAHGLLVDLNGQCDAAMNEDVLVVDVNTNFVVSHCRYLSEKVMNSCGITA